ncbi:MAG TPA: thrombospondin type 3 repeat-containing protein [Polyangiaceae bacterium]|nr:thrombospondin type 3 repeat-containing protein [Polyangiaceae bacterium]
MRIGRFAAALGVCWFLSPAVSADEVPSLDLRGFRPSTDPAGNLYLEPTATPGHLRWNVGAWASYAHRLVTITDATGKEVAVPVQNQLSMDYGLGFGIGDRLAFGALLPSVLYQDGYGSDLIGGNLPHSALGDLRLDLKATLLPGGEMGGFSVAALGAVTLPTGNASSYISEQAATGELRVLSELRLIAIALRATAGVKVRGAEQTYVGQTFGHQLPWGFGLVLRPQVFGIDQKGRWEWALEAHGALAVTPKFGSQAQSPAALGLSARYTPGTVSLIMGAEVPLDSAVGTPAVRGILGLGWAPRVHDRDTDGVPDEVDQCPELAEDKDGFEDSDGCPDFDNDDDGVPDDSDRCPAEKEDSDEFEDDDGCLDADNDHDGVLDAQDACPKEAGTASSDPKQNGCPERDRDVDGIFDSKDKCPAVAEDRDAFQDEDGCPDPDNDGDHLLDTDDACPLVSGEQRSDPLLNGCPSPDKDGDTFDDSDDRCPDQAEDFEGIEDGDGCPEAASEKQKPKPALVALETPAGKHPALVVRGPIAFQIAAGGVELDPKSDATVRALAQILNQNPNFVVLVGARAKGNTAEAEQRALNQSFALVFALRHLTHRDQVAETVSFQVVKQTPGAAARGIGFGLLE